VTAHHPWLKISPEKVKGALARVSFDAFGLYHAVELYMCTSGTDGTLPVRHLSVATDRRLAQPKCVALLTQLVDEALVTVEGDVVHLVHWEQPPVATWTDDVLRARWQRGKELLRDKHLTGEVKERDRHLCRYCGVRVNWADRRGATAGTYDHVDPDGGNDIENVVVACRRCNGRKRDRTPEQAGMPLYRPGTTAATIAAGSASPIAASAVPARAPEPRARTGDPIRTESGSNPRAGSARAPARDRTVPTRVEPDLDRTTPPSGGGPVASSPVEPSAEVVPHPLHQSEESL
jgi:5-methylcytosine-specific restriction endonuclease McrA